MVKTSQTLDGFTLIELLVVIAIISLLSSVVLASLNGARESARDARRVQDLRQIETALNLYYNDNGEFPGPSHDGRICSTCSEDINTVLSEYMQAVPEDPIGNFIVSDGYYYYYDGSHDCEPRDDQSPTGAVAVVFAFMESGDGNIGEVCPDQTGSQGYGDRSDTYKIILGDYRG